MEPLPDQLSVGHSEENIDTNVRCRRLPARSSFVSAVYLRSVRDKKREVVQSTEETKTASIEWKG